MLCHKGVCELILGISHQGSYISLKGKSSIANADTNVAPWCF